MAKSTLPYLASYGYIPKVLEKIKQAKTPPRFSQDYLSTTLQLSGGAAKPLIPFLKRTGFLASDGTPTQLYERFRGANSGAAAAEALRVGYKPLYEINEFVHDVKDDEKLADMVAQATGAERDSVTVKRTVASFNCLRAVANFAQSSGDEGGNDETGVEDQDVGERLDDFRLAYTINLNLPATSDVAVFDAIFRSLKEHLIR